MSPSWNSSLSLPNPSFTLLLSLWNILGVILDPYSFGPHPPWTFTYHMYTDNSQMYISISDLFSELPIHISYHLMTISICIVYRHLEITRGTMKLLQTHPYFLTRFSHLSKCTIHLDIQSQKYRYSPCLLVSLFVYLFFPSISPNLQAFSVLSPKRPLSLAFSLHCHGYHISPDNGHHSTGSHTASWLSVGQLPHGLAHPRTHSLCMNHFLPPTYYYSSDSWHPLIL